MNCAGCGHENPDRAKFCLECGSPFAPGCRSCGTELPAGARFCLECGTRVAAPATRDSQPAPTRSPRDYTPRHLADKILQSKSALEGERKQVTVLFADVKGSMDIQEEVDPEDWHGVMDRFFQILTDGVHRFEGTVNQYTGDGIMALFGAPIAHEDHAQRACYAALHLTDALRDYARELRRERSLDFSARMGINSGTVVVGKIGDDLRMDYTAQGQTVGLAARMEALAEPGGTYLTGHTAELAGGYFELEDLGEFKVKGVAEPVPVFELIGVGQLRTRFDVSRARGLSQFVGRDVDMQVLESAFESAREGKGRAVGIVAPAGVGKSRLCFEFTERCRARGIDILQGHCVAHGKNIPLLPVLEIFRTYFGIGEKDDPRHAREKIAGRLLLIDEQFREVLPIMFDFLGVPDPARPSPTIDPEARQRQIIAVVRRLIESANPDGFVILIEDLHWADPASDAFTAEWVDAIANGHGLLLLNFRPEYRAAWMQKSWYQQMPLDPLGPEAIRDLLDDLIGDDASVLGLAGRIHERTRGNPYFTEEIVRSLIDAGVLQGSKGSYRLTRPIEAIDVPDSVHAVLSARIDRLPEREKKLLQTAAVVGKEFAEPILAAVAELPGAELSGSLASLCGSEFIHQQALYPIAEYAFAHPLTQEVALGSQLQEQRRRTHGAVARAIQEIEPESLEERAALVAHHYEEAGEELDAARWHGRAATWVGARDFAEALRHWQRVRDLLVALPEERQTNETIRSRLVACANIVIGGWRLGLDEKAMDAMYEEGCALAERTEALRLRAALKGGYGGRLSSMGRIRDALALADEVLREADAQFDDPASLAGPRVGAAFYRYLLGHLDEALALMDEGTSIIGTDLTSGREVFGFSYGVWFASTRAVLFGMLGRCAEAAQAFQRGSRLARESGIPENLAWVQGFAADMARCTGEESFEGVGDARVAVRESVRIAEEIGSTFSRVVAYGNLGALHAIFGEWDEAEPATTTALELGRERRVGLEFESLNVAVLSQIALGKGDAARARTLAEESLALAQQRGQAICVIQLVALARALCASEGRKSRDAVERTLKAAEASVAETGAHGLGPLIPEARAELASVCGDTVTREHYLREAHRLYKEIGAAGHARRIGETLGIG